MKRNLIAEFSEFVAYWFLRQLNSSCMNLRNKSRELQSFFHKRQNLDGYVIFAICVAFTIFHFICANFPKTMETYPDELRYYEIARSFISGRGISYRTIPFDFQKIAYSLIILPAFLIKNGLLRNSVIAAINSILMTLSVIPIWSIANTLHLKRMFRYMLILTLLLWPDMFFSMTFMTESLFWPLFFTFVALLLKSLDSRNLAISAVSGAVCYFCYLCKEISLAFILAYISFEILSCIKFSSRLVKFELNKVKIIKLTTFILTFLSMFILMKLTIFNGMKNSYTGITPRITKEVFFYILYAFLVYSAAILLAGFFFPIVYPIYLYRKLEAESRKLFLFILLFIFWSVAVIIYTATVQEDIGNIAPRIHLRYIAPSFILVFAVFLSLIQDTKIVIDNKITHIILFSLFFTLIFKGFRVGSSVDQGSILWYEKLQNRIGVLEINGIKVYLYALIINFCLCFVWGFVHFCFRKSKKLGYNVFSIYILVFCIIDSFFIYKRIRIPYEVPDGLQTAIQNIEILQNKNKNVLFIGSFLTKESKFFETYFDKKDRIFFSDESNFDALEIESPVKDIQFYESIWHRPYQRLSEISYIVLLPESHLAPIKAHFIPSLSSAFLSVYEQGNPETLGFEKKKDFFYSFKGQNISNGYDKARVRYINPEGYSFGPYIPLQSGTYTATISGKNLELHRLDVYSRFGEIHHCFTEETYKNILKIHFSLEESTENLEIFIQNKGSSVMALESFVLKEDTN